MRLEADKSAARSRWWRCSANNAGDNSDADDATSPQHSETTELKERYRYPEIVDMEGRGSCLLSHDCEQTTALSTRARSGSRHRESIGSHFIFIFLSFTNIRRRNIHSEHDNINADR